MLELDKANLIHSITNVVVVVVVVVVWHCTMLVDEKQLARRRLCCECVSAQVG